MSIKNLVLHCWGWNIKVKAIGFSVTYQIRSFSTLGSIPWLITGEVFAHESRPAAIAVAVFVNWTGNLAVGLIFPVMQVGGMFWNPS